MVLSTFQKVKHFCSYSRRNKATLDQYAFLWDVMDENLNGMNLKSPDSLLNLCINYLRKPSVSVFVLDSSVYGTNISNTSEVFSARSQREMSSEPEGSYPLIKDVQFPNLGSEFNGETLDFGDTKNPEKLLSKDTCTTFRNTDILYSKTIEISGGFNGVGTLGVNLQVMHTEQMDIPVVDFLKNAITDTCEHIFTQLEGDHVRSTAT